MPKINQEEYVLLKSLSDYWKWIARDKNGRLYKFQEKPKKVISFQWNDRQQTWLGMSGDRFQFIQWEDEEPHNIAELIEEYEKDYKGSWEHAIEFSKEMRSESEETEVKKDIKWLKEELDDYENRTIEELWVSSTNDYLTARLHGGLSVLKEVKQRIDQLDEQETLSQEWIGEHAKAVTYDGIPDQTEVVYVDDLQNLLVPKQEVTENQAKDALEEKGYTIARMYDSDNETVLPYDFYRQVLLAHGYLIIEKPVIPEFVAEWISKHHERLDLYPALKRLENNALSWKDVYKWYRRNTHTFVNAYLTGKYEVEVEKEQKYYVLDKDNIIMIGKVSNGKVMKRNFHTPFNNFKESAKEKAQLTEQEIKDYDERFWPFAVKVEETEE